MKALFFDIDGTLVSFKTHTIPQSAVEAIERAHSEGIKIFISTGRPCAIINNLGPIDHLIDGYITMNGAATIVDGRIISSHPIPPEIVGRVLQTATELGTSCVVVGRTDLGIYNPHVADYETFESLIGIPHVGAGVDVDLLLKDCVYQLTPFLSPEEQALHSDAFRGAEASRWCPYFCDVTAAGVDKGHGVRALCREFGIDVKDTVAFGDGGNDIPMLRACGIGVAMGNASDEVKAAADAVTASVDDNGIADFIDKLLLRKS